MRSIELLRPPQTDSPEKQHAFQRAGPSLPSEERKRSGAILQSPRALLGEKESLPYHLSRSKRSNLGREPFFLFPRLGLGPQHSFNHTPRSCGGCRLHGTTPRRSKQAKLHLYTCGMLDGYYHQQCHVRARVAVANQHDPSRRIDSSRAARTRLTRASAESAASAAGRTSVAMPRALGWWALLMSAATQSAISPNKDPVKGRGEVKVEQQERRRRRSPGARGWGLGWGLAGLPPCC